jgi:hypothetical protein
MLRLSTEAQQIIPSALSITKFTTLKRICRRVNKLIGNKTIGIVFLKRTRGNFCCEGKFKNVEYKN